MRPSQNIISPKNGLPIISFIQDFLTWAFYITSKEIFFNREQLFLILGHVKNAVIPYPALLKPTLFTGKQLVQVLFDPQQEGHLNFVFKEKFYDFEQEREERDENDGYV